MIFNKKDSNAILCQKLLCQVRFSLEINNLRFNFEI